MVLRLKTRESRSLPGLLKARKLPNNLLFILRLSQKTGRPQAAFLLRYNTRIDNQRRRRSHHLIQRSRQQTHRLRQSAKAKMQHRKNGDARATIPKGLRWTRQSPRDCAGNAGWSSPVARQAHNLKAAGSNPAPATTETCKFTHSKYLLLSSSP